MAYVRPVFDRRSDKDDPHRRPIGYEVRYRDGMGRQRTKGGFRRKRDAEAYAVELEAGRLQGTLVPHAEGAVRFEQVAASRLASIQNRRRPRTVDGYEKLLDRHVLPAFRGCRVGAIGYAEVDRFVRSLESNPAAVARGQSATPSTSSR